MFNRISSATLTFILILIAWMSTNGINPASLTVFVIAWVLFIICTFIFNWRKLGFSWPHLLLPIFYLVGIGSVFVVLPTQTLRILFLIPASLVFYFLETQLGHESHFLQNLYLFSVFAVFIGLNAVQFYFRINTLFMSLLVFLFSYMLIVQGFAGFSLPVKKYFSVLIALICAEVAWGLSLWPTFYVVNAIIIFSVFYLLWIFSFSAFFGKLSRNKIYWQLSLVFIALAVVLVSANFKPLSR
jgi:hypothetical protein